MACWWELQERYEEAEPLYRRALGITERQLGGEHPSTATSLNNLGILYYNQKKYDEAELFLKRACLIAPYSLPCSSAGLGVLLSSILASKMYSFAPLTETNQGNVQCIRP
ncbi:MAG TPA: tetratricopeptide repeat protein [Ktedonobacteraceae bacterium]